MTASEPNGFCMCTWNPLRLLGRAGKSLLRDEDRASSALETLPEELFPPLFMAAYARGCHETLKAMVQAWPFAHLPLGGLAPIPTQKVLEAVLGGLDLLLAQKVRPRRWRLRVLDLRNASQNLWGTWSAATAHEHLRVRPVTEDGCRMEEPSCALTVCIDLCLQEKTLDEAFTYLLRWASRRRRSVHLCCRNVKICGMPIGNIKKVLNRLQLGCILELEVKLVWKLSTLSTFAPYLGQMTRLQTLVLPHVHEPSSSEEKQLAARFTSQLLQLHHLRKLHMDSPAFLEGCLDRMLRCLRAPLETLSITCCQLTEWDLVCLSQGPSVTQLKELDLSGVRLSSVRLKPLQVLLDAVAATLQTLNLEHCDLLDTHLEAILPALSRCHQLRAFRVGGNSLSTAMVRQLLQYNPKLDHLSLGMSPFPVANYHSQGITYRGRIAQAHARIIWLSNGSCLHWDRISDGSGPLTCPWELPD